MWAWVWLIGTLHTRTHTHPQTLQFVVEKITRNLLFKAEKMIWQTFPQGCLVSLFIRLQ
jgi:hypothetical protein